MRISIAYEDFVPCSFIMFFLAFGHEKFNEGLEVYRTKLEISSVQNVTNLLSQNQVLCISNANEKSDNSYVLYLGCNLFLCWESGDNGLFIQSSEQIDKYNSGVGIELYIIENVTTFSVQSRSMGILQVLTRRLTENSARSEDGRKLRMKIRFYEENSELFDE